MGYRGQCDSGELLIKSDPPCRVVARRCRQAPEALGVDLLDHAETRFVAHVVGNAHLAGLGIEHQRRLTALRPPGVITIEWPDTRVDGQLLLLGAEAQIVSVRDAVTVGNDERRSLIARRLLNRQ